MTGLLLRWLSEAIDTPESEIIGRLADALHTLAPIPDDEQDGHLPRDPAVARHP